MTGQYYSHLNPKCDSGVFEEKGGCGVFAREPIKKGELICLWGGRIVSASELDANRRCVSPPAMFFNIASDIETALQARIYEG